jgi:DNA-binding response OmpR family regulator
MKILIIEDKIEQAEAQAFLLRGAGYDVRLCHSAAGARILLEGHRFDLVLLDISLPDEDGRNLLTWMRTRPRERNTPVIISTGLPAEELTDLAEMDDVLVLLKPYTFEQLLEAIKQCTPSCR